MPGLSRALAREAGLVLGWFVVLGIVGGVLWWAVTPLAEWTRTAKSATMDEANLGVAVASDGWFFVIAAVGGLVSGFVLAAWRRRDPVATVVLLTCGSALATVLMRVIGRALGPGSYEAALRTAEVGARVPVPLTVHAPGIYLVLTITTLITALAVLWGTTEDAADVESAKHE